MDDRSLQTPTAVPPDMGTAAPTGTPTPIVPMQTATTPNQIPQPGDNSNAPDASTPAAKSIPASLVNNPQVESQKAAAQVDANKNSASPFHTMLRHAAIEMLGGPQYRTDYKPDGTAVRTPVEPSLAHLGLALAAEVLKGGIAGGNQKDVITSAQAGQQVAEKQRAAEKQAQIDQDAQAKADQNHKLAVVKNNLETHQLAMNVGKQDLEMNQAYVNSYEPVVNMLENHSDMIQADIPENEIQAGLKTGKYNVTKDLFIPHGDPVAVMDPATGKQKEVNGVPVWSHNYYVVDAAAKGQLTQEVQDMGYKIGKFRNPDGSRVAVPTNSEYPMATIGQYATQFAQIQTAEEQIERHKDEVLGDKKGPRVSMADSVAQDPSMMQAVRDYSRFVGVGAPDQVLGAMMQNGKGESAAKLMDFMGVTPDDIRKAENQRLADAAEAKNVKSNSAELDAQKRLDLLTKDPITATNADSIIAAHNKPAAGIVIPEDRYQQAVAFNEQQTLQAGKKSAAEAKGKTDAEAKSGDIQELAQNIVVGGDLAKISDVTSMRGGQRTAMANALHDAAVAAGKNPNDYSAQALATKAEMYKDYREGKTSNNIQAFDAFLGHAGDALGANEAWRRSSSPLINKPLNWFAKNLSDDPNYVAFTTALEPVRKEFMSFLNANRAEHESDIKTMETVLSNDKSPAQIETALKQLGKSADIRLRSIGTKYHNTMGQDFPNLVSDEGKQTLQRMGITGQPSAASNAPKVAPEGTIINTAKGQQIKQGGQWVSYQGGK
jgi:hypothetical protein